MKFLTVSLLVVFLQVFCLANSEHHKINSPVDSNLSRELLGEVVEKFQEATGLVYESVERDGPIIEFTNVSSSIEGLTQFDSIRITDPYRVISQELQTFTVEIVGMSMLDSSSEGIGFDRLVFEIPSESLTKTIRLLATEEEPDVINLFKSFQMDNFVIDNAFMILDGCDFRVGSLEVENVDNLNIARFYVERLGLACDNEDIIFQMNLPYIYIDKFSAGKFSGLATHRFLSAVDLLTDSWSGLEFDLPNIDSTTVGPIGFWAEKIRISDFSGNFDGVLIETDAVSLTNNIKNEGNLVVSSMTPLTARINIGSSDSELAESTRRLFDLFDSKQLILEFRQEQHFDIKNDTFSMPLEQNYFMINDLARFNLVIEVEGLASILREVEYMIAARENPDDTIKINENLMRSNLKYNTVGFDITDFGLIDFGFEVASQQVGLPSILLRELAAQRLGMIPHNKDFELNDEEQESLIRIVEVLNVALENQGTLSARFNIDDSIFDLEEEEFFRKLILEFLTLEFVN